jgi:hypothetical protein
MNPNREEALFGLALEEPAVADLSPLRGLALTDLRITGCTNITNLEPIAGIKTLRMLILPPHGANIELLRGMTNLTRIGFKYDSAAKGPDKTAAEFWADYDTKKKSESQQT